MFFILSSGQANMADVIEVFKTMRDEGIQPDVRSFASALETLGRRETVDIDMTKKIVRQMHEKVKLYLTSWIITQSNVIFYWIHWWVYWFIDSLIHPLSHWLIEHWTTCLQPWVIRFLLFNSRIFPSTTFSSNARLSWTKKTAFFVPFTRYGPIFNPATPTRIAPTNRPF